MPKRKRFPPTRHTDRVLDAPVVASIDLHGDSAVEAGARVREFLSMASRLHRGKVVRIITGRGRGSIGRAVLLPTVARLLKGPLRAFVEDHSIGIDEGSYLVLLK